MTCIDGFIWIGESNHRYRWFDCRSPKSCAISSTVGYRDHDHCFVHEAERRGVSRKVSHLPAWIVPGESKVFLAHHAGLETPYRGKILGYFVVSRIDFIGKVPDVELDIDLESLREAGDRTGIDTDVDDGDDGGSGGGVGGGTRVGPSWPDGPIEDLLEELAKHWIEKLIKCVTDRTRPTVTNVDDEVLAEHRSCSKRIKPGAVYLVDVLCAVIDEAWADLRLLKPGADVDDFNDLVDVIVAMWKSNVRIPEELVGKATTRGEMVLFDDPPFFEAHPKASFRSIGHIDGDHLLDQVIAGSRAVDVRHCVGPVTGTLTKRQISAALAEHCHLTVTAARELQDELAGLARTELERVEHFRLPHIGTIRSGRQPTRPLTEARIASKVAEATGLSRDRTAQALDHLADVAASELHRVGRFRLSGVGTFERHDGRPTFTPHAPLADKDPEFEPYRPFVLATA